MKNLRRYEEIILNELKDVSENELPKILEILQYVKAGILSIQRGETQKPDLKKDYNKESAENKGDKKGESPGPYFNIQNRAE